MDSILTSIKKLIGIEDDNENFDADIIIHINSFLAILEQVGEGFQKKFLIKDKTAKWSDFLPPEKNLEDVKTYVYLRVKLIFDPPSSPTVIESIKQSISELEWRIQVNTDSEE